MREVSDEKSLDAARTARRRLSEPYPYLILGPIWVEIRHAQVQGRLG